jgi:hypothetical protein
MKYKTQQTPRFVQSTVVVWLMKGWLNSWTVVSRVSAMYLAGIPWVSIVLAPLSSTRMYRAKHCEGTVMCTIITPKIHRKFSGLRRSRNLTPGDCTWDPCGTEAGPGTDTCVTQALCVFAGAICFFSCSSQEIQRTVSPSPSPNPPPSNPPLHTPRQL